jgi:hypothetical protein
VTKEHDMTKATNQSTRRPRLRLRVSAAAITLGTASLFGWVAAQAVSAAPAAPASPAGGAVHVFVDVDTQSATSPILLTGAIGDFGKATVTDKNGKPDDDGNYVHVALKKGTFLVNETQLNKNFDGAKPTVDQATCSLSVAATGPVTLSDGTGLYRGVHGTVKMSQAAGLLFPLKADGTCNMNAKPQKLFGELSGVGHLSFT